MCRIEQKCNADILGITSLSCSKSKMMHCRLILVNVQNDCPSSLERGRQKEREREERELLPAMGESHMRADTTHRHTLYQEPQCPHTAREWNALAAQIM
jgi:hypothetical protein